MNQSLMQPLAGVRVLDLSRVMAGPLCGMALADLGADVIKVEHPERGDDTRDWGVRIGSGNTSYFNSCNRNKRSLCVDLQDPEGQALVREIAATCDVVIQNFKYGGVQKMGLGYDDLRQLNPEIVYCSISGYSVLSQEKARPGYDLVIQGETGLMAMNGEEGQGPLKFGIAAVDMFTGMYAAQAILAVLYERTRTGEGRHIQMSLYDSGMMITSYYGLTAWLNQGDPAKFGNSHPSIVPYGVFDAADGPLVIAVGNNGQFRRFCDEVIQCPELPADPKFATNTERAKNRHALLPILLARIRQFARAELIARMNAAGIPCGEVLGLYEALQSERTEQTQVWHRFEDSEAGPQGIHAPPYIIDGGRAGVRHPPPHLGEHTQEVLREWLGMDEGRLESLSRRGVIK
ncbi:CaiB/BaiF CoA transferase family protein [Variovorax ginsengisoli]|uniref:Crotonobetainyl-CoA:carnitine CoA-transferase CaiB-like acyl-CoA transferase n=1 Tax=Variovorax ginsengisoli TaxID=363844 RepID=A0ABT9SEM2_9BURK|nr:CoA transferase [Variovorax ginsengisoli]MDP9902811.1 crotonobetainyl-CoA:carnitine CoA-transferase CaiB-like acyl-CoA transferase [Variovorax ginsengisoli]